MGVILIADLTTVSTFEYSVQGNRRIVSADVSSAGFTTADTVSFPHLTAITAITEVAYRTTVWDAAASTVMVGPIVQIGSSANAVQILRSSLAAFPIRLTVEGR